MARFRSVYGLAACWCAAAVLGNASARTARELGPVELVPVVSGRGAFVTFGCAFKKGDVRDSICMERGGQAVDVQVDAKRRYEDGSVKHAIITAYLPVVAQGEALTLALEPAAALQEGEPISGLPDGLQVGVVFDFPDGSQTVADLRRTFTDAQAHPAMPYRFVTWLSGPLVTEYQVSGPPVYRDGRQDPDLWVTFGIRVYRGMDAARLEVVVENSWADSPGNVPYKVRVLIDGTERYGNDAVGRVNGELPWWLKTPDLGHSMRARWRKVLWWGRTLPEVQTRISIPYLVSTGLVPHYDTTVNISRPALDDQWQRWQQSPRDILEEGIIRTYFPAPGGREEIGPLPTWTALYLLSQDYRQMQVMLGTADLAGGCPSHVRDRSTGRIVSIDEHPDYSTLERATVEVIPRRDSTDRPWVVYTDASGDDGMPALSRFILDNAHQASFAYAPYLLTGDYYYLEEMYFWGNWCILWHPPDYRGREKGLLNHDQERGHAWGLRQLVDAAKIAPDRSFEAAYFDAKVRHNLGYFRDFVTGPYAVPVGTYSHPDQDLFPTRGLPDEIGALLRCEAPWQHNFLAWALEDAVQAGYAEAVPARDYFTKLQVGITTHADEYDPVNATPYFLVIGSIENGAPRFFTTWRELYHETFDVVTPTGVEALRVQQYGPHIPDYGGSYSYIARAICCIAAGAGLRGAQAAIDYLDANTIPHRTEVWSRDPTWAIVP